jgi:transglutaminase-like putative cysteine protease
VQRPVDLNIAILAVGSAALFGLGQPNIALPLGVLAAASLSFWLTDVRGRFAVGGTTVNAAIFGIAVVSGWLLLRAHALREVVILGHAVACLQAVLLFEAKTDRTRWDVFSLSLLLVFLSTFLVQGPLYGLGLLVYFFLALSALALLLLDRERRPRPTAGSPHPRGRRGATTRTKRWIALLRLAGVAFATLIVGPLALFLRFGERIDRMAGSEAERPRTMTGRFPWLHQRPVSGATVTSSWLSEALGREFWWRIGRITAGSAVAAMVVFVAAPRFGRVEFRLPRLSEVAWDEGRLARRRMTGLSDRVRLGELGTLSENQQMALEVEFLQHVSAEPYRVRSSVYLRGAVLTQYREGHWEFQEYGPLTRPKIVAAGNPPKNASLVRQRIAVEPSDRRSVCCVWPFLVVNDEQPLRYNARTERIFRPQAMINRSYSFDLATTAFENGYQSELTPSEEPIDPQVLSQWPAPRLPGLARLAESWVAESGRAADDPLGRARYLEGRLRSSRRFSYTLNEPMRDAALDPIEDFVTNHPQGHCEYFASALVLMLRSQGIPSRLVVGYRTEDYSPVNGTFRVRESHAHAWVEAYIPPDRLPAEAMRADGYSDWSLGAWLRLDPTPSGSAGLTGVALLAQRVGDWIDWVHSAWRDHVLGMSGTRQQTALYRPLAERVKWIAARLTSIEQWRDFAESRPWELGQGFLWQAWLVALAVVLGVLIARRKLPSLLPAGNAKADGSAVLLRRNGEPEVEFYRRLEALLGRSGYRRDVSQTQREFAEQAGEDIAASTGRREIARLTVQIAEAYYRVRFGRLALSKRQRDDVETALKQISRPRGPGGPGVNS